MSRREPHADTCTPVGQSLYRVENAIAELVGRVDALAHTELVPLGAAAGRVLAHPIRATIDVPATATSAMDGFAICADDALARGISSFPISQRIAAGETGQPLTPGSAARIFTGAPLPPGADTVVIQEDARIEGNGVHFATAVKKGAFVRERGEDIRKDDTILNRGSLLRAQEIGLAASVGVAELSVFRRLRVGLLTTGDELVMPGERLAAGQIFNTNLFTLQALLNQLGCDVVSYGVVRDCAEETELIMRQAADETDLIISSGGVSVGEEDHVKNVLEKLGELRLWRVAVRPGKPLAFGTVETKPFIGLPGNPVSAFVTFCLFALPVIKTMQGRANILPQSYRVAAGFRRDNNSTRRDFLRAALVQEPATGISSLRLFPNQGSGALSSLVWADGLACVYEQTTVEEGDLVEFYPFSSFGI